MPCDYKDRLSYRCKPRMPKIAGKPSEDKRQGKILPYIFHREHDPAETLTFGLLASEL